MSLRTRHQRRFYLEHLLVTLVIALLSVLLVFAFSPTFLDRYLYDRMLSALPDEQETELIIVGIDEFSLREMGRWPWDRARLAELIERLTEYKSGPVLFDLLLTEPDLRQPDSDRRLADAMEQHGNVYLPVHIEQQTAGGQLIELLPHNRFASKARALGHVDLEMDSDGVVRSVFLRSGIGQAWWPHIALAMLDDISPDVAAQYPVTKASRRGVLANVREYQRFMSFAGDSGTYPQVSAVDVIKGRVPPQLLQGRIVLVGATAAGLGDQMATPLSVQGQLMSGVELNANIFDGLRHQQLIERMSTRWILVLTLVIGMLSPLVLPLIPPRWGMPMIAAMLAMIVLLGQALLRYGQVWMPIGAPLLVTLIAYPLWTWRRLEYTLDYLKAALSRLSQYSALNRRLGEASSVAPLLRMLDRALPITAWRLEMRGSREVQTGGEDVNERTWQTARADHFSFQRGAQRYELSVLWRSEEVDLRLREWLVAMTGRVNLLSAPSGAAYEVVENYIERVSEEELRQQALTQFFSASFEQLREGVVLCDACGSLLFANGRAMEWLKIDASQIEGLHLLDLTRSLTWQAELGDWPTMVSQALLSNQLSLECQSESGAELLLEFSSSQAGSRPGRILIITIKDITAIKSALRTRTELLDFLSHDLRSPMISVLALAEKMRHSESGAGIQEFLDSIELHARKNLSISEQFLQLARVEALGRVEMAELDMLPVVESAIEQVQAQASDRHLRVRFHYDARDDVWVRGNHELLERLVVNLLTNAVKYSHEGNSIDVTLSAADGRVCCEVRDRGIGIAPEFVAHVFDRYSRAQGGDVGKIRGAGLGLRFVKVVSERHSGDISVTSQPGEGSRFVLSLPQMQMDES
ncbi:MAG: CHASE2 domain-containing protein [Alcanivoracaceae bacterium]|nr:CHASE2 domain-containing protein [Alcanivoracaceae bacterium]